MSRSFDLLDSIPYTDENGNTLPHFHAERTEQLQARQFVPENATVLELGARYGMVSCSISYKLNDPSRLVVVEPDHRVIDALIKNRDAHGCCFHVFHGVVSRYDQQAIFESDSYATYTMRVQDQAQGADDVKLLLQRCTLEDLQEKYNLTFDCLVADCEGALASFFEENLEALSKNFHTVIFEKDAPQRCDYDKIEKTLQSWGFQCVYPGTHCVWLRR